MSGVLNAVIEEMARVGYSALRVEDVAARAQVNKTTIYRRWPTKSELVRAALSCKKIAAFESCALTGSLRGDLLEMGRCFVKAAGQPEGLSVMRMLVAEGGDPEVADLHKAMREDQETLPNEVLAGAIERGELTADADNRVMMVAFFGAIFHMVLVMSEPVTSAVIERLVDVLLLGALQPSARKEKPRAARSRQRV
ncbi:MAG TPA: TetR/AcrR family transcriptional regulator [Steroidobacteraceae bacterium]